MTEVMTVREVDFMGSSLIGAQDNNGTVWAGVRWICNGIGLTEKQSDRQIANVQSDMVLSQGGKKLPLKFGGQVREVLCIQLDYVPLWLAKISVTPAMQRDNPELAERLVQYQLRAKDVLAAAFIHQAPAVNNQAAALYDAMKAEIKAELRVELLQELQAPQLLRPDRYRTREDRIPPSVKAFMGESTQEAPGRHTSSTELYRAYWQYCKDAGQPAETHNAFSRALGAMGVEKKRTAQARIWLNIRTLH